MGADRDRRHRRNNNMPSGRRLATTYFATGRHRGWKSPSVFAAALLGANAMRVTKLVGGGTTPLEMDAGERE
jgi:hypothetical protein